MPSPLDQNRVPGAVMWGSADQRIRSRTQPRMPRTVDTWPRAFSRSNLAAVARARMRGATVSWNGALLRDSVVARNALVSHHALVWSSTIDRYVGLAPFTSVIWAEVGPFSGFGEKATVGAMPHFPAFPASHDFALIADWGFSDDALPVTPRSSIGADVWLGAGAIVRAGVRIGHGAVVGAGSVVTRDIDPYDVVAGVPARRIRRRFTDDVIDAMLHIAWWDWPPHVLRRHVRLFQQPLDRDCLAELVIIARHSGAASSSRSVDRPLSSPDSPAAVHH